MATFIPEIGDITPQVEYFRPNLELMAGYLETRQGRFNQSRDELNNVYTQLKSLDLTLDDNKQRREEFFKAADQELKKLASVDISLPENLTAAKRIFDPLVKDDAMVEDLLFTGKIKNVLSTAEKFKNSSNEEDRKRYNPLSMQYAALKQQEYINANPEARSSVAGSNISYASNVNLLEKATALAKEMDLNVSLDSITGGYRVTDKNGNLVVAHLQDAFQQSFLNDPEVQDFYRQKSYVDVQTQVQNLAGQIGYESAIEFVSTSLQGQLELTTATSLEQAEKTANVLNAKLKMIENKISTEGIVEGSEEHREYLNVLKNLEMAEEAVENSNQQFSLSQSQISSLDDLYNMAYVLDLSTGITDAAQTLSMRGAERSVKADEFALEAEKQRNRINLALLKDELDYQSSGGVGPIGPVDPVQNMSDASAGTRGASMTEQALESDYNTAKKALSGYMKLEDDAYKTLVTHFLSKKNGGVLSSAGGTGQEATVKYFELLDKLNPQDRAAQIDRDLKEITSSNLYDAKLYEDLISLENSLLGATEALNSEMQKSFATYQMNFKGEDRELSNLMFDKSGKFLSKEEFVQAASNYINQSLQYSDQGASQFFDYRKYIAGPKGGGGYTQDVRPQALANFYDDAVEDAGSIFKNTGFNIHTYFDPDIQGQGSGYSIEVNKSYNLDPLAYYDSKRMGHANSLKAFTALSSMVDGTKMADSYFYSGSMNENNYLLQEEFDDADDNKYGEDNLGTKILNQYVADVQASQKSGSLKRPFAILDLGKGVTVGNKKYVAAQITYDADYIANLKEIEGYEEANQTYTMFVPQNVIGAGIFASDGTGALMSSIKASGEQVTKFPGGNGEVTYTYDENTGLIEVYGKIKQLDAETGSYQFKQYVESTNEEDFEVVRQNVWTAYQAAQDNNKDILRQLESTNSIIRVTDPAKLR